MKEKIRELREHYGWTQERLSWKMNVSLNTVKSWESGRRNPSIEKRAIFRNMFKEAGIK